MAVKNKIQNAVRYIDKDHVRVGPEVIQDPASGSGISWCAKFGRLHFKKRLRHMGRPFKNQEKYYFDFMSNLSTYTSKIYVFLKLKKKERDVRKKSNWVKVELSVQFSF